MSDIRHRSHRDLIVWQKAVGLAELAYRVTLMLPRSELYGLHGQIRRAATSIPANIAEGAARRTTREFVAFLHVARGSLAELETHFLIAQRVGLLDDRTLYEFQPRADEVGRLINGVLRGLRRRSSVPTSPTARDLPSSSSAE
jgi:four helix bundle protein